MSFLGLNLSVFFEGIKLWEQKDQLLRKSSQIKLLKMVLESKEINKQLVIVQCHRPGGGGGGGSHMKQTGMLVVSLRGVNFGFWSRLGSSGQSTNILSRQGLV